MPRNGNFVPGGGGNVRWADGISNSLNQLSRSLIEQDSSEKARNDQLERDRLASKSKKDQADESKRRFDLTFGQTEKKNKLLEADRASSKAIKEKEQQANEFLWRAANAEEFTVDDLDSTRSKNVSVTRENLLNERRATIGFLSGKSPLKDAVESYRTTLGTSDLSSTEVNNLVQKRKQELEALRREDEFTGSNKYRSSSNEDIDKRFYEDRLTALDDSIRKGDFLTKEERVSAILDRVPNDLKGFVNPNKLRESLSQTVSGVSEKDLVAAENARVAQANDLVEKEFEFITQFYKKPKTFTGKTGLSRAAKVSEGLKYLSENLGAGSVGGRDADTVRKAYQGILSDPVLEATPDEAVLAILLGVETGGLGTGVADLNESKNRILALRKGAGTKKGSTDLQQQAALDFKKYKSQRVAPRSLSDLKTDLLRLRSAPSGGLGALPMFMDTPAKRTNLRDELLNRRTVKVEEDEKQEVEEARNIVAESRDALLTRRGIRSTFPGQPLR